MYKKPYIQVAGHKGALYISLESAWGFGSFQWKVQQRTTKVGVKCASKNAFWMAP